MLIPNESSIEHHSPDLEEQRKATPTRRRSPGEAGGGRGQCVLEFDKMGNKPAEKSE